jgi:hypothetical protein
MDVEMTSNVLNRPLLMDKTKSRSKFDITIKAAKGIADEGNRHSGSVNTNWSRDSAEIQYWGGGSKGCVSEIAGPTQSIRRSTNADRNSV